MMFEVIIGKHIKSLGHSNAPAGYKPHTASLDIAAMNQNNANACQ